MSLSGCMSSTGFAGPNRAASPGYPLTSLEGVQTALSFILRAELGLAHIPVT